MRTHTAATGVARCDGESIPISRQPILCPRSETSVRLDHVRYRPVCFYGSALSAPLAAAADYLRCWEDTHGHAPHVLCVHDEFSAEDAGSDLAWKVTLVLGDPDDDWPA